ncbi:hypothetical protein H5410_004822, partial [Solanum commersonii]
MKSTKRRIAESKTPILGCFWLARDRGRKTKTTKLIDGARESDWAKVETVLNVPTQCSRETELIW